MMKKSSKVTLADKIAGVLSTTPASYDPEDDHTDDTRAKLVDDFSDDNGDEELLSTFRKQNIDLLSDIDVRYAGKKVTRKNLQNFEGESSEEDQFEQEDDETDEFVEDQGSNKSEAEENEESNDEEESDKLDDEEESGESDEEEGSEDSNENNKTFEKSEESDTNFKHFKDTDMSAQIKKGLCVRNQMNMWENLLEMRIQLQKCLIAANKMPQIETYTEIKKQSGSEFVDQVGITKNSLANLLDKLLVLQKLSLSKYPETKKLNKSDTGSTLKEDDDEDIPSDTEDEMPSEDEEENETPKKKRKLNDFEKDISEGHNTYKNYRNSVIQKWNDKTRIAVLKNNTNSHSIINHIEHTLSDKSKLIKRTQLKRSDYTILGQDAPIEQHDDLNNKNDSRITQEYNTEIFDDDDFYHQLLRELIEVKSADLTDPIQLSRQWIQLQKLRSKMKRKIDTKATKGRKIRYTVHTKLVNFMAPIDEHLWTDKSKTELFSSLFGKKG